jgi:hypothetical protein
MCLDLGRILNPGGPLRTTDAHLENRIYLHDFISFSPKTKENLFPIFTPFYEKGLSI